LTAIRYANLALRFVLELCAYVALGYWGFQTGDSPLGKVLLGIGAPLLAIVIWGLFVAPRAVVKVPGPVHLALQVLVFGGAAVALALTGHPILGAVFATVVLLNGILIQLWER